MSKPDPALAAALDCDSVARYERALRDTADVREAWEKQGRAGPAGFYLIRGGPDDVVLDSRDGSTAILPGPAPGVGDDPLGEYGEIPIVVQDRSFNADGSLFYPDTRAFFDDYPGPYIPDTPVSPIWNPEY